MELKGKKYSPSTWERITRNEKLTMAMGVFHLLFSFPIPGTKGSPVYLNFFQFIGFILLTPSALSQIGIILELPSLHILNVGNQQRFTSISEF